MYNEERPSFRGLIVKVLVVIIFVFLLMWLFPFPKMTPVYDRLFADNIDSMKDAAKGYYTTARMPKDVGDKQSITLSEMIQQKMVLPLIDSEGKTCDGNSSYVEVTKMDNEYLMKINLSCSTRSDYVVEHIGCYDFCENCNNEEQQETMYQFYRTLYQGYKMVNGNTTEYEFIKYGYNITYKYSCPSGTTPVQGDQTHCLVSDHWVDTKTKTSQTTTTTEKVNAETTTTKVFDHWGSWVGYSSAKSLTPLSTYPNTYDGGSKMRKLLSSPSTICTDCSSDGYYVYALYKRTAYYRDETSYKACAAPLKPISGDSAHCLKTNTVITMVCDTANGYRENPSDSNSCIKDLYGSHQIIADKEENKTKYVSDTKWSTSKTLSGYEATGHNRIVYVYNKKVYSGWVTTLPAGYSKSGEKKQYTWSKYSTLGGWQSTGQTKKVTVY